MFFNAQTVAQLDTTKADVSTAIVTSHNSWRSKVDKPEPKTPIGKLTWSEPIANYTRNLTRLLAQEHCLKYANRSGPLNLDQSDLPLAPRETTIKEITLNATQCGENRWFLYASQAHPLNFTWDEAIETWASRRFDYSFGSNRCGVNAFSQMIWNDSKSIGCGAFDCLAGSDLFVLYECLYCPK